MAEIREVMRKSNVLKQPSLPCLSRHHTINLLAGCPYECRYCYAQSFHSNPGNGNVVFYANTLDMLRQELPRKRKKPGCVYFSTACEPFVPYGNVLDTLYAIMVLLLEQNISLLISTKSSIPDRFIKLFIAHSDKVHVQVGLTMSDDRIRQVMEPNAGTVEMRLETLRRLANSGVSAEVRMDPLIPGLTDTDDSVSRLCERMTSVGATHAVASYLFLRQANSRRMLSLRYGNWSFIKVTKELYTEQITEYCSNGAIRIPEAGYRRDSYQRLKTIAEEHGVSLVLCRCKNPDITTECCHPQISSHGVFSSQMTLFD